MRKLVIAAVALVMLASQPHESRAQAQVLLPFIPEIIGGAIAIYSTPWRAIWAKAPPAFKDNLGVKPNGLFEVVFFTPPITRGPNSLCPVGSRFWPNSNRYYPDIDSSSPYVVKNLNWWGALRTGLHQSYASGCWSEINECPLTGC